MKKIAVLIGVLFCLLAGERLYAQDTVYKKNGEVLKVKITEVLTDGIKYRVYGEEDGPLYTLDKNRVARIVYQNGRTETFADNLRDPELYADQKKRGIKVNFLAPVQGFMQFTYEQNSRPGRSWEAMLGIIGLGRNPEIDDWDGESGRLDARGAFVGAGYKFVRMPNFVENNTRYWHIMQGAYIEPSVFLGMYSRNMSVSDGIARKDVQFGGLLLNLGKQWVLGDLLLVDLYGGLGYAFDSVDSDAEEFGDSYKNYHYALFATENSGLGFTAGLKVGILLK